MLLFACSPPEFLAQITPFATMSHTEPSGSGFARRDTYHAAEYKGRALLEQFKSRDDTRTKTSLQQPQLEDTYELNANEFCPKGMERALRNLNTVMLAAWNVDINRLSGVEGGVQ